MKIVGPILAFVLPAALVAYLYLRGPLAQYGTGNLPTATGLTAAGLAFLAGFGGAATYHYLSRRRK